MIGIIGAMPEEINYILEKTIIIEKVIIAGLKFYELEYNNKRFILVESGVGKVNASIAASILCNNYKVDLVISSGIAGGMKPLKTKTICLINNLYYGDVDATAFGYDFGQVPGESTYFTINSDILEKAKIILEKLNYKYVITNSLTSDSFITKMPRLPKDDVFCFEMESTAIVHTCSHYNVKTLVLRYISDIVGEESQITDYAKFEDEIAYDSSKICLEVVNEL